MGKIKKRWNLDRTYEIAPWDIFSKAHTVRTFITAAIEGMSDCPGEPWETSMPKMRVGTFDTIGMDRECSLPNREFIPPNYKRIKTFDVSTKGNGWWQIAKRL